MKKLFALTVILILSINEISAECYKVVVGVDSILSTKSISELTSGYDQDIQDIKEMIEKEDTQANRDYYQGSLDDAETKKEELKKSYEEYGKFLPKIISKFQNNIEIIVNNMSTSSGIELRISGNNYSNYILFSYYSMETVKPPVGKIRYELHDVVSGEIVWVSNMHTIKLSNSNTFSEEWVSNAWTEILNSVPKSIELETFIRKEIDYKSATLEYKYDDESKKEANGREKGVVFIQNINSGKRIIWVNDKPRNIAEFTLKAKQGNFVETNEKEVKFIPKEYKKNGNLKYDYKTYNCNKKSIKDKLFETFILERSCFLGENDSTIMAEIKVPFECPEPYYTVTTSHKIIKTLKVLEKYRGLGKDLKSYQEDKDTYYVYIDADNAKIMQYHVDAKSTRKIHRETYKLNFKSCLYEVEKEDKLIKNMGGSPVLKSEDAGWGFEDDTKIYVILPSSDKELSFTWGRLREIGRYSNSRKYKKEIPQGIKNMMDEIQNNLKQQRSAWVNPINKGVKAWKSMLLSCGAQVAHETFFIPPLDVPDLDIDFRINIRPSTKSEIKVMKKYIKNGSNNPMNMLKLLQTMQGRK